MVLICISLIISNVGNLFMCLLDIQTLFKHLQLLWMVSRWKWPWVVVCEARDQRGSGYAPISPSPLSDSDPGSVYRWRSARTAGGCRAVRGQAPEFSMASGSALLGFIPRGVQIYLTFCHRALLYILLIGVNSQSTFLLSYYLNNNSIKMYFGNELLFFFLE